MTATSSPPSSVAPYSAKDEVRDFMHRFVRFAQVHNECARILNKKDDPPLATDERPSSVDRKDDPPFARAGGPFGADKKDDPPLATHDGLFGALGQLDLVFEKLDVYKVEVARLEIDIQLARAQLETHRRIHEADRAAWTADVAKLQTENRRLRDALTRANAPARARA